MGKKIGDAMETVRFCNLHINSLEELGTLDIEKSKDVPTEIKRKIRQDIPCFFRFDKDTKIFSKISNNFKETSQKSTCLRKDVISGMERYYVCLKEQIGLYRSLLNDSIKSSSNYLDSLFSVIQSYQSTCMQPKLAAKAIAALAENTKDLASKIGQEFEKLQKNLNSLKKNAYYFAEEYDNRMKSETSTVNAIEALWSVRGSLQVLEIFWRTFQGTVANILSPKSSGSALAHSGYVKSKLKTSEGKNEINGQLEDSYFQVLFLTKAKVAMQKSAETAVEILDKIKLEEIKPIEEPEIVAPQVKKTTSRPMIGERTISYTAKNKEL